MSTVQLPNSDARKAVELLAELIPEHADAIRHDATLLTAIAGAQRAMGTRPESTAYAVGLEAIPDDRPALGVLIGRCRMLDQQSRATTPPVNGAAPPVNRSRPEPMPDGAASRRPAPRTATSPSTPAPAVGGGEQARTARKPARTTRPGARPATSADRRPEPPPAARPGARPATSTDRHPEPPPAARPTAPPLRDDTSPVRPRRRRRTFVAAGAVATLAMALVAGAVLMPPRLSHAEEQAASPEVSTWTPSSSPTSTPSSSPTSTPSSSPSSTEPSSPQQADTPFGSEPLYVRPDTGAAFWAAQATSDPRRDTVLNSVANKSLVQWFSDDVGPTDVDDYVQAARKAGQTPVLISHRLPNRACNNGGLGSAEAYRAWVSQLAGGLKGGPAIVILEPWSLVAYECLSKAAADERMTLLREAITTLTAEPRVAVYLDGGGIDSDADSLAELLARVGLERARGFSVNIGEAAPTEAVTGYAEKMSARLRASGAKGFHYVVDTSRSGGTQTPPKGPACNPSWARVGEDPQVLTGSGAADAYVWTRQPGASDGRCGGSTVDQFSFDPQLAMQVLGR